MRLQSLPLPTQARLLRVLENGEFLRVGSSEVEKTNVRIVCATNVNLPEAIAEGRFREDLYYRLSTVPISVPPLRKRGDDVVLLFKKFCIDFATKYNVPRVQLDEGAVSAIVNYSWPGNIRHQEYCGTGVYSRTEQGVECRCNDALSAAGEHRWKSSYSGRTAWR